jgi:beta-lactam-binding protein with PASTA domain
MPDVVGMNHQLAQDTLQANGFYLLLEKDVTGQGRMLVYDRNWEVVSQSVDAGTQAATDAPVTLYSRKIGE